MRLKWSGDHVPSLPHCLPLFAPILKNTSLLTITHLQQRDHTSEVLMHTRYSPIIIILGAERVSCSTERTEREKRADLENERDCPTTHLHWGGAERVSCSTERTEREKRADLEQERDCPTTHLHWGGGGGGLGMVWKTVLSILQPRTGSSRLVFRVQEKSCKECIIVALLIIIFKTIYR